MPSIPQTDGLFYKPNAAAVFQRLTDFFSRQAMDRIFARCEVPSATLKKFQQEHPAGECAYPDIEQRAQFWDKVLKEKTAVEDDDIPSVYLTEMDQGLYAGLIGAEVRYLCDPSTGWISSMTVPMFENWDGFESLTLPSDKLGEKQEEKTPQNLWLQKYLQQLNTYVRTAEGCFGVSHFIVIDSLNFIFELIGATETYLSLELHPEMVRRATEFGYELTLFVQDRFFAEVPLLNGGTCSNMMSWVPDGRIVSESVDPFHMTSVDYFERWGREPIERLFSHYDGGVVHLHANGRHLVECVASLKGLRGITFFDDIGLTPSIEIVDQLRHRSGDTPIRVDTSYHSFIERLTKNDLPGGVLYHIQDVPDCDTANQLMEQVRAYRV